MALWSTPITWVNGAVTAAQMNSLRDNLVWLKGFGDNITAGTAADSGSTTYLNIRRAAVGDTVFQAGVPADTLGRIVITADGKIAWGDGGAAPTDTALRRSSSTSMELTGAYLNVARTAVSVRAFSTQVVGEAHPRMQIDSIGYLSWGD